MIVRAFRRRVRDTGGRRDEIGRGDREHQNAKERDPSSRRGSSLTMLAHERPCNKPRMGGDHGDAELEPARGDGEAALPTRMVRTRGRRRRAQDLDGRENGSERRVRAGHAQVGGLRLAEPVAPALRIARTDLRAKGRRKCPKGRRAHRTAGICRILAKGLPRRWHTPSARPARELGTALLTRRGARFGVPRVDGPQAPGRPHDFTGGRRTLRSNPVPEPLAPRRSTRCPPGPDAARLTKTGCYSTTPAA